MDLTPLVPAGRQVIERYAASGFRVSGVIYRGPVLVFPDRTVPWDAASAADVTWESLAPVVEHGGVEILLLGLGRSTSAGARRSCATRCAAPGSRSSAMDTGAACRTYNVLVAEDRRVAAALIPPTLIRRPASHGRVREPPDRRDRRWPCRLLRESDHGCSADAS